MRIGRTKRAPWLNALLAMALVSACGGSDDDGSPSPRPNPTISVSPSSAAIGEDVTVRADGFASGITIVIGFGPPESEYEILRQVRTDEDGAISLRVEVPTWAEPGREYVWVAADRDNEPRVISDRFRVR